MPRKAATSLHHRAIENLGQRIVDGSLPEGHVMLAEQLETELNVSRSVIREAVRVLQSSGLVETIKRVGIRVLPASFWNPFDPLVIRWRLASAGRGAQLRSLAELRTAVEPIAAELAAANAPEQLKQELLDTADELLAVGKSGDAAAALSLDIRFHALMLAASGNPMFARLADQVAETLSGRTSHGLMPEQIGSQALHLHVDVAQAIWNGDYQAARTASESIMRQVLHELSPSWADQPRSFGQN
ncbi:FadR/GntR family transcriptional regulator [Pseudarthrobacter sp. J1738]|uniref:FadR/GntR family transcriptional regulator n=1 Tax=Pseudarthrobacter sp. J1738 TaxID=3420446 RepID=UPI003D2D83F0